MANGILIPTSIRIPKLLKKEAYQLIKKGYYSDFSSLVVTALRDEIKEYKKLNSSVKDVREIRQKIWQEYLEKAKGNPKKAAKLMYEEDLKDYEKNPEFWK